MNKSRGFDTQFYRKTPWLKLRKWHFYQFPLCQLCESVGYTTAGDVVDHIIPRSLTLEYELEPDNLQTLCHRCHSQKTNISKNINDVDHYIKEMKEGKLRFIAPAHLIKELFYQIGYC